MLQMSFETQIILHKTVLLHVIMTLTNMYRLLWRYLSENRLIISFSFMHSCSDIVYHFYTHAIMHYSRCYFLPMIEV